MQPADIGRLTAVGDPRLSPDASSVVFTVTTIDLDANEYRSALWLAAVDASSGPRAFTSGEHKDSTARWSPDGGSIAFVRHEEDSKEAKVCVIPAGGEARPLFTWKDEVSDLAWSPDGRRLAFLARDRDEERYGQEKEKDQPPRRITRLVSRIDSLGWIADRPTHVFVVDVDGGDPVQVTDGEFEDGGLSWSPDGDEIAFAAGRHDTWDLDQAADLYTVSASGGAEPKRATETGPSYARPSWSPDGSAIAFHRDDWRSAPRHGQVGVLDRSTGDVRLLTTDLDRNCSPYPPSRAPVWVGGDLFFTVEDSGNVHLYRIPADGSGKPELIVGGDRQVGGIDAVGGALVYTVTTPMALPELFVRVDGKERQLTNIGDGFRESVSLVEPERFTATAADGTEVEAWFMRPVGAESGTRYPTLLNIHGGPFTQYGNRFFDEFQLQVAAGYAVIYANPGSSGYSEAWGRAIRGRTAPDEPGSGWGGVDYEDLMAVVDEAVRRYGDVVDGERLGVLGGSYGGYMTSWIIGHTDRFKAAVSERSCNNLLTMEHTSDFAGIFRTEMGVTHLKDPEEYLRVSPISYVREMHTPLLILHSENDLRCPVEQAEDLFVALRMLGRTPEFLRFPGESHEALTFRRAKHRVQRNEAILDFFDRHL